MLNIPEPAITQPVDISNTLAKIANMRHADMINKNLQSEMAIREANSPSLIAERESQNALRVIQKREAQQKTETEDLKSATRDLGWISSLPEKHQRAAFTNWKTTSPLGQKLPVTEDMMLEDDGKGNKVWSPDKFYVTTQAGMQATELRNDKNFGDLKDVVTINPNRADTENPWVIQKMRSAGYGKWGPATDSQGDIIQGEPTTTKKAKEVLDAKKLILEEKRVAVSERGAATAERRAATAEGSAATTAKREARTAEAANWSTPFTTDDGKSLIQTNSKTGEVKVVPVPGGKTLEGKPGTVKPKGYLEQRRKDADTAKTAYKTADDVKADYKAGKIKKEDAAKILQEKFGMK